METAVVLGVYKLKE